MKIGLVVPFGNSPNRDVNYIRDFSQALESLGFNSLWVPEHVIFFPLDHYESKYPYSDDGTPPFRDGAALYDPLFVVAAAAQVTTELRFSTSVLVLPQRPALLTAKEVMTLDHLTQGRFEFGVGAGWSAEEYEALGASFKLRGRRFDEYIEAIRVAWSQERASFSGEFISFENVILLPKPVTPGGPPFLIGGDSIYAMKRAARIGDGWYGWWADYDLEPHLQKLRELLDEHGRAEGSDFHLKLGMPLQDSADILLDKIEEARRLGVEELVLSLKIRSSSFEKDLSAAADMLGLGHS